MAKFHLKFIDSVHDYCSSEIKIENYHTGNFIDLLMYNDNEEVFCFSMDVSTAIKYAKTLRTKINELKESEVNNGR